MYWPISASKSFSIPPPLRDEEILRLAPSKRGNFFALLTKNAVGVWDVRPTVPFTSVVRTPESVERWGDNVDVIWAADGRGLIILTSTSHLLIYQLTSTSRPAYHHHPSNLFPAQGGAGEGEGLGGWVLRPLGVAFVMGRCTTILPQSHTLLIGLQHPPAILSVPWPIPSSLISPPGSHFPPKPVDGDGEDQAECEIWELDGGAPWVVRTGKDPPYPIRLYSMRTAGTPILYALQTSDGRSYSMFAKSQLAQSQDQLRTRRPSNASPLPPHQASPSNFIEERSFGFTGQAVHPMATVDRSDKLGSASGLGISVQDSASSSSEDSFAHSTDTAANPRFGLVAIGLRDGLVSVVNVTAPSQSSVQSHVLDLKLAAGLVKTPGTVTCLAWTSDGYAIAVGYENAWAIWSVSGRLNGWGMESTTSTAQSNEPYMDGILDLFWAPGNLELFVLAKARGGETTGLHSIPFVKDATTSQHSPDNTRYAFLQMDDRVLAYRGADQPDESVINPESDVWQHIKIPNTYISSNWPIRYASISSDGKLIAVAGRRGLTHYSAASGRWKLFGDESEEKSFVVKGGLLWFHHVLVVAVEVNKSHQIRLYSRDADLSDANILHSQPIPSPILVTSLLDNSLLVYTADNTLYHFLILPSQNAIRMHVCGSISFAGILQIPSRVRALSWLIPQAQKDHGDPADDLIIATIIFLVDGKLILLRPRRAGNEEVRYDMQVLADKIEAYWTHLHGIGTLENSLWGFDGRAMRVWLDALTIEATQVDPAKNAYETVKESIYTRLDFYPLSILMDKGIIIGVDYETSTRSLPFTLFKLQTGTHLFLPQFLRYHLSCHDLTSALIFASNYASIVYFAHSLEILLHSVLEDEVETGSDILPLVIEFLDHFPESLDVVVSCARKTEIERWNMLFDAAGKPRDLFERCLQDGSLRTAAGYLLVLQNLEELDDVKDTERLLRLALKAGEFRLCKEVLRFLRSVDETGVALRKAIEDLGLLKINGSSETPTIQVVPLDDRKPDGEEEDATPPRDAQRLTSPFQLVAPRQQFSPPSPRTILSSQDSLEGETPRETGS